MSLTNDKDNHALDLCNNDLGNSHLNLTIIPLEDTSARQVTPHITANEESTSSRIEGISTSVFPLIAINSETTNSYDAQEKNIEINMDWISRCAEFWYYHEEFYTGEHGSILGSSIFSKYCELWDQTHTAPAPKL
jgi:hypothetical protein